jgi:membrane protein DedA with SNARE-associated domain
MLQHIITYIGSLDPWLIYIVLFFFSFIENVFPPSPSDVVVLVGATLITNTTLGFIPILIVTSIGSGLGFILMYYVGEFLGEKLIRSGRFKFIKPEYLKKADIWFLKYGYNLILINRFMPGTRSVISFFSGVHRLKPIRTFTFATISAFIWNAFLIFLGIILGNNLELVDHALAKYSTIAAIITVLVVAVILIKLLWKKKKTNEVS